MGSLPSVLMVFFSIPFDKLPWCSAYHQTIVRNHFFKLFLKETLLSKTFLRNSAKFTMSTFLCKNIGSALLPSIKIASPCNLLVTFIDQFCACYLQYDPNKLFKQKLDCNVWTGLKYYSPTVTHGKTLVYNFWVL